MCKPTCVECSVHKVGEAAVLAVPQRFFASGATLPHTVVCSVLAAALAHLHLPLF
jgi:hypothetical protein